MSDQVMELIPAKNGVLRDPKTGRIVSGAGNIHKITPENSNAFHRMRQEKMQAAARAAIAKAANTGNSIAGMALGIETIFARALSPDADLDKARKAILSAGRVAGLIQDHSDPTNNGQNMVIPVQMLDKLIQWRERTDNQHGNE